MPLTKSTGDFGGDTHVIGDAVFGIGMVATHEIELVVASMAIQRSTSWSFSHARQRRCSVMRR